MGDWGKVKTTIENDYESHILPSLEDYIRVENGSPDYDPTCLTNGLMDKAMDVMEKWMVAQNVKGLKYERFKVEGRTPFIFVEIEGTIPTKNCIMMYGHMDKQPPLTETWSEGLHPFKPVRRGDLLYGRGSSDDGYAIYAAIESISALQKNGIPHGRIVITLEACEESGSVDLDYYFEKVMSRVGGVDLIVCLDSGALNYSQLWLTASLRGCVGGTLTVKTTKEAMHSGVGGGVLPDAFRIARLLLDRIEDPKTGDVLVPEFHVEMPEHVRRGLEELKNIPESLIEPYPLLDGMKAECDHDNLSVAIRNAWKPSVTVTGCGGIPEPKRAGNVIAGGVQFKISVRIPPMVDSKKASDVLQQRLTENPPFGAKVEFTPEMHGLGWAAPPVEAYINEAMNTGSQEYFNRPMCMLGMGGSIPLMGELQKMFPTASFMTTGVLGPQANAHGPNEFLHIPMVKGVTYCVARTAAAHALHAAK